MFAETVQDFVNRNKMTISRFQLDLESNQSDSRVCYDSKYCTRTAFRSPEEQNDPFGWYVLPLLLRSTQTRSARQTGGATCYMEKKFGWSSHAFPFVPPEDFAHHLNQGRLFFTIFKTRRAERRACIYCTLQVYLTNRRCSVV